MSQRRSWAEACRPVTCAEFAAAMYRAGQTRREVVERLQAMERWTPVTVQQTAYLEARRLGLRFGYGGGSFVGKTAAYRHEALRRAARDIHV